MTAEDLNKRAIRWLEDAKVLRGAGRYESAVYLCGYAVEFALKFRICKILEWAAFRDDLPGMKTHNLVNLLNFTALEGRKKVFQVSWDIVAKWNPEIRYDAEGSFTDARADDMVIATEILLKELI
jgi:HEPN domain-containing protein